MRETSEPNSPKAVRLLTSPSGAQHELPATGSTTIGSAPAEPSVLHFEAAGLEARHCVIGRTKRGGWALKDLGSHAGCLLNGERVTSARLKDGDRLRLGELELQFGGPDKPKAVPQRLGGFRIEAKLGVGGMGEVLLAIQESLDRRVALKLLKQRLADDAEFVQRFQKEAKSAAALNHPHVVHVYDVGIVAGRHYLAMEYMEGGTLEDKLTKTGPLSPSEVHRILCETAAGLAFAESRDIVHRDIKPENLMLDGSGRVKIADLGLATSSETESGAKQPILGTPHFMAPEQARGGAVDGRADLYALGATAFRLLTGKTPYSGDSTREILRAHFTQPIPLASASRPDVPAQLDSLIFKLMAKDPSERYSSAGDLLVALESIRPQTEAAPGRSRLPLVLATLAVATLVGFFALGLDSTGEATLPEAGQASERSESPQASNDPKQLPAIPEVKENAPEDNETLLQDLERRARAAYAGLAPIEEAEARVVALKGLIQAFSGTTLSTEAAAEVLALEKRILTSQTAATQAAKDDERFLAVFDKVVAAAPKLADGAPTSPGDLLAALVSLKPPGNATLATNFEVRRKAILTEVIVEAQGHVLIEIEAAEALAMKGEFDAYQAQLEGLLPYFDLEPLKELEAPQKAAPEPQTKDTNGVVPSESRSPQTPATTDDLPAKVQSLSAIQRLTIDDLGLLGLKDFLLLKQSVRNKIIQRRQREQGFVLAQHASDRELLAACMFSGAEDAGDFSKLLMAFDFQGAKDVLAAQHSKIETSDTKHFVEQLMDRTTSASLAFSALISAFPGGGWRRGSVPLPYGGYATAIALDSKGLTVQENDGPRSFAWSSYRGSPELIHALFNNRLKRDFTPSELEGISCLALFAAIEGALLRADRVLIQSPKERFDKKDLDTMVAAFDAAKEWATRADSNATLLAIDSEIQAVKILATALVARVSGQDAISAARLERLLRLHSKSLTVLLLSDGRGAEDSQ